MAEKRPDVEEENLTALLRSALGQPRAQQAGAARPEVRKRRWTKLLVAAAAVVMAVVGAMWLLRSGPEPRATFPLPTVSLPFPELLAEGLRKIEHVDTLAITIRTIKEGQERVHHAYYRSPRFFREELTDTKVSLDDGSRSRVIDLQQKVLLEDGPSAFDRYTIMDLVGLQQVKTMLGQDERVKMVGPLPDRTGGAACQRYDFEITMPARPQIDVPERAITGSCWFSVESGLLLRLENRSGAVTNRCDFQYHAAVDASLFTVPEWALSQAPEPTVFKVVALEETGRPLPGAQVYVGWLGSFKRLRADAKGEAVMALQSRPHKDPNTNRWYTWLPRSVIVESVDGAKAAVFTLSGLRLVLGDGLKETLYGEGSHSPAVRAERDFSEERSDIEVTYDPEENLLSLTLTLMPKATVTGRVVDPKGNPITDTPVTVWGTYQVRGRMATVAYGQLDAQIPPKGSLSEQQLYFNVESDGTFELLIPANYPFTLGVEPLGPRFRPTWKETTLEPGAAVSLGDIVLPYASERRSQ